MRLRLLVSHRGRGPLLRQLARNTADTGLAWALGALAGLRRGKAVHPRGVVHGATLMIEGSAEAPDGVDFLQRRAEHPAIVRFSRSVGLPRPLPDLLGMSVRVPHAHGHGEHQDFLLITSADLPVLHHLFLPATRLDQRPYSSALPYGSPSGLFLLGSLPRGGGGFSFAVASLGGRFRPVGHLEIGRRLGDELDALRFNPWNTGGGLEPAGSLNGMRLRAYRSSQSAWGTSQPGGEARQRAAERLLEELTAGQGPWSGVLSSERQR